MCYTWIWFAFCQPWHNYGKQHVSLYTCSSILLQCPWKRAVQSAKYVWVSLRSCWLYVRTAGSFSGVAQQQRRFPSSSSSTYYIPVLDMGLSNLSPSRSICGYSHPTPTTRPAQIVTPPGLRASYTTFPNVSQLNELLNCDIGVSAWLPTFRRTILFK
jgi:hypothetical protein